MAGYPFGKSTLNEASFNEGKIQCINSLSNGRRACYTDLSGMHGSSGSGVIDKKTGRLIGVFSGSIARGMDEINYFVPIKFLWDLIKTTKKYKILGISGCGNPLYCYIRY